MSLETPHNIEDLLKEIKELKAKLFEVNNIIDSIKEGAIDALVVNIDGTPNIYSLETADYTYRILIEKFGEGALSITEDGLILFCNDYFSKLIDIPANQVIGANFSEYLGSGDQFDWIMRCLSKGPFKGETNLNVNNKRLPVYLSLTDLNPKVNAIGVVVTDLSEKKKHEEILLSHQHQLESKVFELNQMNTNLEEFIHVISHDLKEPLRKLVTYTTRFNGTSKINGDHTELKYLNVIQNSALRLNSLVDDLVKYSYSTAKNGSDSIDLNEVMKEVLEDLELIISENKASIEFNKLPNMNVSHVQMRQLFSNLLTNAIKYKKEGVIPQITISADIAHDIEHAPPLKNYHRIIVKDNGIGIGTIHQKKIFTIFQRLHKRHEYSGNGIGLAICKKIMENHYGKIDVESELNEGSTFYLYFPIAE
jgi:signal transduction histidine kinase